MLNNIVQCIVHHIDCVSTISYSQQYNYNFFFLPVIGPLFNNKIKIINVFQLTNKLLSLFLFSLNYHSWCCYQDQKTNEGYENVTKYTSSQIHLKFQYLSRYNFQCQLHMNFQISFKSLKLSINRHPRVVIFSQLHPKFQIFCFLSKSLKLCKYSSQYFNCLPLARNLLYLSKSLKLSKIFLVSITYEFPFFFLFFLNH